MSDDNDDDYVCNYSSEKSRWNIQSEHYYKELGQMAQTAQTQRFYGHKRLCEKRLG